MFITKANNNGNKLFDGINKTGNKLSPVSLLPVIIGDVVDISD